MRTGSNHLEESLNTLSDVRSFGELFNPVFIGKHNQFALFGIDMAARAADPVPLLDRVLAEDGLTGFRFFHDHDPRVLDRVLEDASIAKLVLTRNPLDSYVSLAIASRTGQWRLTNPKMAKAAQARFDPAAFDRMVAAQREFRDRLQRRLQVTGQTAFWLNYEEIGDLEVLNGLAAFLGSQDRLAEVPGKLKKQNPGAVDEKVENPDEMRAHLATLDPFALTRSVHMEPVRGPAVPSFIAAAESPLLALPLPGKSDAALRDWLTRLDGAAPTGGMTQKGLKPWMRRNKDFVSFALLRHPLARAHDAFRAVLSDTGPRASTVRRVLTNQHGIDLEGPPDVAFLGFLTFLKANLGGQSALPVAAEWATQTALLAGMAQAVLPQRLIREAEAQAELDRLADLAGRPRQPFAMPSPDWAAGQLADEIEDACIAAYRRDFMQFGFRRWKNS
ncbi:nodulation protein NodH [Jannaschia ovalis]|uniref:Nodulation protein NodH n=1 Tax=Jannaschia ovalis TaxID=3038773 RepID=A0ABY8L9T8_9RHOB|nr:nodulation protein NodH [Jannaschia sp. GRR-S6-38]WGH77133.1 nodulation protein NodH [Jannaschia sp. GRR-S6-38]